MIRAARRDELAVLSALALRSKAHHGYSEAFMRACRAELTLPAELLAFTFVKELDAVVIGFYACSELGAGRAELEFLFVEPWAIGRGHGRQLLAHACEQLRSRALQVLEIQGDPHAHAFYTAAGARKIGERASHSIPGRLLPLYELRLSAREKSRPVSI